MSLFAVLVLRELFILKTKDKRGPEEIEMICYVLTILTVMSGFEKSDPIMFMVDYRIIAFLFFSIFIPLIVYNDRRIYNTVTALYMFGTTVFAGTTFNMFVQIRTYDVNYITYIFLIAFLTDLFGLIVGKLVGETRLTIISPKKTLEGAVGGTIIGGVVPAMFFYTVNRGYLPLHLVVLLTMQFSIMGQVGDIVFSYIKREFGKKEFSHIVIGDGGILDIMDSIIFIALEFLIIISLI